MELTHRLFICAVFLIAVFMIAYVFRKTVIQSILLVGDNAGFRFMYLTPQSLFMQEIKLSLTLSFLLTLPLLIYNVLAFVLPAFNVKVLKVFFFTFIGYGVFVAGMYASFRWLIPFTIQFLLGTGYSAFGVTPLVSVDSFVGLFVGLGLAIGIICEIPLVNVVLCKIGLVHTAFLRKVRKVVIVLAFVLAAIITPPDVVSQIAVAVPIVLLYQFSIFICSFIEKRSSEEC